MYKILVLDDEASIVEVIRFAFEQQGWTVHICTDPQKAIEQMTSVYYDLLLTDLSMPAMTGLEVLEKTKEISPSTTVMMMTAYGNMKIAIDAMKKGVKDFIPKPFEMKQLIKNVEHALENQHLQKENRVLRTILTKKFEHKEIIGASDIMQELMTKITKVATTHSNVLITGPTGSGKELVARKLHASSPRNQKTFLPINCSAIPANLLESELFGYVKGAFTGADQDKIGFFEASHGGTLFMDEIGDIPMELQSKLLRVLAEQKITPLGSTQEKEINVRVLAATHKDLQKEIEQKNFREDLYYRLNVVEIQVPALKDRASDIPLLADHFLERIKKEYQKPTLHFSSQALQALQGHPFPGNIRELEHMIEQAVVFAEGQRIEVEDLPLSKARSANVHTDAIQQGVSLDQMLESYEKNILERALDQSQGVKSKAAKLLGITFRSFRYRLKKLGLDSNDAS
jgi:two-component system response regulator PilR (NtrC family)